MWAAGLVIAASVVWGIFRLPDDPGKAPVEVPGWVRLLIEAAFFGGATVLLAMASQQTAALIFGGVVLVHYAISYDRVRWMLGGERPKPGMFSRQ